MGVSQNNNARLWKKVQNIGGGNNQKHSTVNLNGADYNGIKNTYVCSNLSQAPTKKNKIEQENSAVADSGCTGNFMAVSAQLKNV